MEFYLWIGKVSQSAPKHTTDLLIAKLNAYGIDSVGLLLIPDYLSCRKQRTKIGSSYSSWRDNNKRSSTRDFNWALTF